MKRHLVTAVAALTLPIAAQAQLVSGMKIEPSEIKTGESITITVGFDIISGINCGMRLHFGDGTTQDYKINQEKDVPLVVTHAYPKAGIYEVKAEPKTVGLVTKCGGKNQSANLKVAGAMASKAPAAAAGPQCPEGWKLDKKSVKKKTGAFTCAAKAGTPVPDAKLACPEKLGYFENSAKGRLGCQP